MSRESIEIAPIPNVGSVFSRTLHYDGNGVVTIWVEDGVLRGDRALDVRGSGVGCA